MAYKNEEAYKIYQKQYRELHKEQKKNIIKNIGLKIRNA